MRYLQGIASQQQIIYDIIIKIPVAKGTACS